MSTNINGGHLSSQRAIIVGANGGIGSSVARALACHGVATALVGRNKVALNAVVQTCIEAGANSFPLYCDISKIDTIESTVDKAISRPWVI